MDSRHAVLCFLIVLVLHGNPGAVAEDCSYDRFEMPFCFGATCLAECWMRSVAAGARVKEHTCWGGGALAVCNCLLCRK
uniref:Uncharacterized protein n=2 Tax=Avena sativa TaxID=4498 RepID=A0ACD5TU49_AVESA